MEPVRSPRNPRIVAAARLHRARDRHARSLTLLEGPHLLDEAVAAGADIREVFAHEGDPASFRQASAAGIPATAVTDTVLARLAGTENPRGPLAVMAIPPPEPPGGDTVLLAVTEPGNAGTLIRSAAAFGFDVAALPGAVDLWSPKVLRAAAGGHFHTRIVWSEALAGHYIGLDAGAVRDVRDVMVSSPAPVVIVVGNEAHGLPDELAQRVETFARLPMVPGIESLNASVAGSVAMYERYRARTDREHDGDSTGQDADPAAGNRI